MLYTPTTPSTSPRFTSPSPRPRPGPMSQPKLGRIGRWYLPTMAVISLGFGITNYIQAQADRNRAELVHEEQRIRRNRQILDAYGDKSSLKDVENALEMYETR